jgi:hypothetical protein
MVDMGSGGRGTECASVEDACQVRSGAGVERIFNATAK